VRQICNYKYHSFEFDTPSVSRLIDTSVRLKARLSCLFIFYRIKNYRSLKMFCIFLKSYYCMSFQKSLLCCDDVKIFITDLNMNYEVDIVFSGTINSRFLENYLLC
jgi:hypothetical protein